ncbi:MAG TPA: hypothetical protein VFR35_10300 [Actinoplanes sp.]|nr:hypothetical protein [Actinoplanes sp.]
MLTLLLTPALAGCTASASAELPTPSQSPVPAAAVLWTRLAHACPELTSPAARAFGVAGPGRPTKEHRADRDVLVVDCAWRAGGAYGTAVTVRMSIHRTQAAATAQWQVVTAGQERKILRAGGEAYSAVEVPALVIRARSHNAVATVRLVIPEEAASEERFEELRPAAAEITRDVFDDLR